MIHTLLVNFSLKRSWCWLVTSGDVVLCINLAPVGVSSGSWNQAKQGVLPSATCTQASSTGGLCLKILIIMMMITRSSRLYLIMEMMVITRVAEVGRLSTNAKNVLNSFVGRVFAKSRQKTTYCQNRNKKGSFYLVLPSFYLVSPSFT